MHRANVLNNHNTLYFRLLSDKKLTAIQNTTEI